MRTFLSSMRMILKLLAHHKKFLIVSHRLITFEDTVFNILHVLDRKSKEGELHNVKKKALESRQEIHRNSFTSS